MRFYLNSFELNNPANRVFLDEDIEGIDIPTIRTSKGTRTASHGGYIGAQLYGPRIISLKGRIFSSTITEALEKRRQIQRALPLFPLPVQLRIIDEDGSAYLIYCQVIDFKMPIGKFRGKSFFKIELEASDEIIYDDTAGSALTATINKAVPGGVLFSATSPLFSVSTYFSSGQSRSAVINASDLLAMPLIVIKGRTTNPRILNTQTGELFEMTGYAVGDDAVTQIDMKNRTVRLGAISQLVDGVLPPGVGSNAFPYVAQLSTWWGLVPDVNEINFDSSGGSDVSSATLYWRPGLMGI